MLPAANSDRVEGDPDVQAFVRQIRETTQLLLAPPDEVMLDVGSGGELLVARLRAVIAMLLLLLPLINAASGGTVRETMIGLGGAVFVNVFAQMWLALAHRRRQHPWLPFATAAFDVTAATLVLVVLALNHLPSGAQQHGGVVLLPARDRADRDAQRRPRHPVRRRAGAGAVRPGGGLGDRFHVLAGAADFRRLRRGHLRHAGPAAGADRHRHLDHCDGDLPYAAAGGDVGHRRPHRPAQPHLAAPPRPAADGRGATRRQQPVAGADRPGPLQTHQR